jgi:hypothetical protein
MAPTMAAPPEMPEGISPDGGSATPGASGAATPGAP